MTAPAGRSACRAGARRARRERPSTPAAATREHRLGGPRSACSSGYGSNAAIAGESRRRHRQRRRRRGRSANAMSSARPWARLPCPDRRGAERVAAHLERGRDVHRALERAGRKRAGEHRAPCAPGRARRDRAGAQPIGLAAAAPRHARAPARAASRATPSAPSAGPRRRSRAASRPGPRPRSRARTRAPRPARAARPRAPYATASSVMSSVPDSGTSGPCDEHRQPFARDERVDERDQQRERHGEPRRAAQLRPDAGGDCRRPRRTRARPASTSGWSNVSATTHGASANAAATPGARRCSGEPVGRYTGTKRAHRAAASGRRKASGPPAVGRDRDTGRAATRSSSRRTARSRPASSVPVTDPGRLLLLEARRRHDPGARRRASAPRGPARRAARSRSRPAADARARTRRSRAGPSSICRAAASPRTSSHRPTTTAAAPCPDRRPERRVLGATPAPVEALATPPGTRRAASSAQSIRTGNRLPSDPCRNGSGNEPTTAGTRIAALQSR